MLGGSRSSLLFTSMLSELAGRSHLCNSEQPSDSARCHNAHAGMKDDSHLLAAPQELHYVDCQAFEVVTRLLGIGNVNCGTHRGVAKTNSAPAESAGRRKRSEEHTSEL